MKSCRSCLFWHPYSDVDSLPFWRINPSLCSHAGRSVASRAREGSRARAPLRSARSPRTVRTRASAHASAPLRARRFVSSARRAVAEIRKSNVPARTSSSVLVAESETARLRSGALEASRARRARTRARTTGRRGRHRQQLGAGRRLDQRLVVHGRVRRVQQEQRARPREDVHRG